MQRQVTYWIVLSLVLGLSAFPQTGCVPVAVVSGAGAVATSAAEERGIGGVISDTEIKTRVKVRMGNYSSHLMNQVDVVVREGRVLLSGIVDIPEMQIDAVRLAWEVDGVKEVIDELRVGKQESFGTIASDAWISTRLKSRFLFDKKVRSINYNVHTIDGVVYLMGVAQDQEELDYVIGKARTTSSVKKVVSYVQVKPRKVFVDETVPPHGSEVQAPLSMQQGPEAPVNGPPIEVQNLDGPNTNSAFE